MNLANHEVMPDSIEQHIKVFIKRTKIVTTKNVAELYSDSQRFCGLATVEKLTKKSETLNSRSWRVRLPLLGNTAIEVGHVQRCTGTGNKLKVVPAEYELYQDTTWGITNESYRIKACGWFHDEFCILT